MDMITTEMSVVKCRLGNDSVEFCVDLSSRHNHGHDESQA